jgi:hypothetical protein
LSHTTVAQYGTSAANPAVSCMDIYKRDSTAVNGLYWIKRPSIASPFQVYCGDKGWTLIESWTLANDAPRTSKSFLDDWPVNQDSVNWEDYRLNLDRMKALISNTNYAQYSATCNADTVLSSNLYSRDCLVGAISDFNPFVKE